MPPPTLGPPAARAPGSEARPRAAEEAPLRDCRPRLLRLGALLGIALTALSGVGCAGPEARLLRLAEDGGRSDRQMAFSELSVRARRGGLKQTDPAVRERLDAHILERFSGEPNPTVRAEMLSVAVAGGLPGAIGILRQGLIDPGSLVRLVAIESIGELPEEERRAALRELLQDDDEVWVQLAAAQRCADLGDAEWSTDLVATLGDAGVDPNVRFQAYLAVRRLTGEDLPFIPDDWRIWLETRQNPPEGG